MEQSSSRYCQPFTSRSVFTHVLAKGAKQPPGADTGGDVVLKDIVGDTVRGSRPVELLDREGNSNMKVSLASNPTVGARQKVPDPLTQGASRSLLHPNYDFEGVISRNPTLFLFSTTGANSTQ